MNKPTETEAQGHCPLSISRSSQNYLLIHSRVLENADQYVDTRNKAGWIIRDLLTGESQVTDTGKEFRRGARRRSTEISSPGHLSASIVPAPLVSPVMTSE
jgi:hypothetical protein